MTDVQASDAALRSTAAAPAPPETMSAILKPFLASAVRHALTVAAGALVAHGTISGGTAEQLIGVGMGLAGVAWAWWDKRGRAMLLQDIANLRAILQAKADAARATKPKA